MESTENDILADKPVLIHPDPHTLKHSHTLTRRQTRTHKHTCIHTGTQVIFQTILTQYLRVT